MSKRTEYLEFAKSQIGIKSGDKYRKWYNKNIGNLGSYNWHWCAAGLVYCAEKCGILKLIPNTASSSAMLNSFKVLERFKPRGSYTPKGGDIIFFRWKDATTPASHVGMVEYVQGSYVHTVEFNSGNSNDGEVARWVHPLNSTSIVGYGVPKFPKDKVCIKGRKSYIRSNSWLDSEHNSSRVLKTLKVGDKVDYIKDDGYGWSKVKSGNITGYIQNTRLDKPGLSAFRDAVVLKTAICKGVKTDKQRKINKNSSVTFICSIEKGKSKGKSIVRYKGKGYYIKTNNISVK